jgi:hypothetical protein
MLLQQSMNAFIKILGYRNFAWSAPNAKYPAGKSIGNASRPAFLIVCLALGACSPYVYENEVATFGKGVDASVQAFQSLMPPIHDLGDRGT